MDRTAQSKAVSGSRMIAVFVAALMLLMVAAPAVSADSPGIPMEMPAPTGEGEPAEPPVNHPILDRETEIDHESIKAAERLAALEETPDIDEPVASTLAPIYSEPESEMAETEVQNIQEPESGTYDGDTTAALPSSPFSSAGESQGAERTSALDRSIFSPKPLAGPIDAWLGYNDGYTENSIGVGGGDITMAIELTDVELAGYRGYAINELYVSIGSDDYGFYVANYDVWIETTLPDYGDVYTGGVNVVYSGTSSGTGWENIDIPDYTIPAAGSVVIGLTFWSNSEWPCGLDQSITGPTPRANYCTFNGYGSWGDIGSFGFPGVWGIDVGVSAQDIYTLTPSYQQDYCSFNGEQIDYPLTLTNNGLTTETFDLSAANNGWPVEFLYPAPPMSQMQNPSFETGDLTGWTTIDLASPYVSIQVSGGGNTCPDMGDGFLTAPTDGSWSLQTGWDGDGPGHITAGRDYTVQAIGSTALLFDYRASWDLMMIPAFQDRTFSVNIEPAGGGAPFHTKLILTAVADTYQSDTGILHGTVDLTPFAGTTVFINFDWWVPEGYSGPAYFELDNLRIVSTHSVVTPLSEVFEGAFPPLGWTVIDNEGTGVMWDRNDAWGVGNYVTGGTDYSAACDSDTWGADEFDTELWTPSLDFSGMAVPTLAYDVNYQNLANLDFLNVDISMDSGVSWVNLLSWNEDHGGYRALPSEHVEIDLAAYAGQSDIIIRWHYFDPNAGDWDWYVQIDNVHISDYVVVTSLGPIGPGEDVDFIARVTVPGGANPGDFDVADITATPQPYLYENFDAAFPPAGWTVLDPDTTGGWYQWGSTMDGTSGAGVYYVGGYNSDEWLISPAIDLTQVINPAITYDCLWDSTWGTWSEGYVLGSIDGGATWPYLVHTYPDSTFLGWHTDSWDISSWAAGQANVAIAFHYVSISDDWYWAIDNVVIDGLSQYTSNVAQIETIWPHTFPWYDDMESGTAGWAADGMWHLVDDFNSYSPTHSWWYGQDATGNYDNGMQNWGRLETPLIDLRGETEAWFSFAEWYETEPSSSWDIRVVQINTGSGWTDIEVLPKLCMGSWMHTTVDLTPYCGDVVRLGLWFDTGDNIENEFRGWYVDNFYVGNYAVDAWPNYQSDSAYWTETVDYSVTIDNIGALPDFYYIWPTKNTWSVSFWDASGTVPIGPTPMIPAGGSLTITARVTIPSSVMDGSIDRALIYVMSNNNYEFTADQVLLETTAYNPYGVSVSPGYQDDSGYWTENVDYYIYVENTGVWSDRYNLAAVSTWPVTFWNAAGTTQIFTTNILPAGGIQTVLVRVTVPYGIMDGTTDLADISVVSQGDPTWTMQTVQVETEALNPFGMDMYPATQADTGYVSTSLDYFLTIENTGVWNDRYDLSMAGNLWPTTLWNTAGTMQIISTPVIAPGATYNFIVRVSIPSLAPPGSSDLAAITATSQGDPVWTTATCTVETFSASPYDLDLTPNMQEGTGAEGTDVNYMVFLENTGAWGETFDLTVAGNAWPVSLYQIAGWDILHSENFEGPFPPAGWTVMDYAGTGAVWERNDFWPNSNYAGGSGFCAAADSDAAGHIDMTTGLRTPSFSLAGDSALANLEFDMSYNSYTGDEYAEVRISLDGGATWEVLAFYDSDMSPWGPGVHITLDLSAYVGNSNVMIEFLYANAWYDWFWQVDNVRVSVVTDSNLIGPITSTTQIPAGETIPLLVRVHIPVGIPLGAWDLATVVATSHNYFYVSDAVQILTNGQPNYWFESDPPVQTNFGSKGEWVVHRVWITNQGAQPDIYLPMFHGNDWWTKFFTVDLRPQGIYNGIDDGTEHWWWGPVQPGETKEYVIKVFVPTDEVDAFDHAWISLTSNNDPSFVEWLQIYTRHSLPAPFFDNFELAGWDGEFGLYDDPMLGEVHGAWTRTVNLDVGIYDGTSYTGDWSLYVGGSDNSATTCKIDLRMPYAIASAVIQRGDNGFSDYPEAGKDLIVEYSDGNFQWAQWHELGRFYGGGMSGEVFTPYWILPEDALNARFQLRFRTVGGNPWSDFWHIDNVFVGAPESALQFHSGMSGFEQISGPGFTATYDMYIENLARHGDTYDLSVQGNAWPTWAGPNPVGPMGPNGNMPDTGFFNVYVNIPMDALPGSSDTATIVATSVLDPAVFETFTLTTTVGRVHNFNQNTWYMDIQPAVNAANPGDEIFAYPGFYNEHVIVNKPLSVIGNYPSGTIIDGTGLEFGTGTGAGNPDVLLLYADDGVGEPLRSQLIALGGLGTVDEYDARYGTPTLADILAYDVVITWTDYTYDDGVAIGNLLADYIDNGGSVIQAEFNWYTADYGPGGRFITEGYSPFISDNAGSHYANAGLGAFNAAHPIMAGVTSANDYFRDYLHLSPGAELVASWTDGEEFVATKGQVIGINSYPGIYRQWTGQVDQIFHNSIFWLLGTSESLVTVRSDDVHFTGFTVQNAPTGILLDGVQNCEINWNVIQNCGNGISLENSGGNHIHDNLIMGNSGASYLPNSLETMFASNAGWDGNMFDLTPSQDILIKGFDCNIDTTGEATIEVYYREGSYLGFEFDPSSWNLVGTVTVTGQGDDNPTHVPIDELSLSAGQTYGIYIAETTGFGLEYTTGANTYDDGILQFQSGIGIDYPFGPTIYTPRTWNGRIYYTAGESTGPGIYVTGEWDLTVQDDFSLNNDLWTWQGIAYRNGGGYASLTDAYFYSQVGRILYNEPINTAFIAEFDYYAGGGDGADGLAMNFFKEDYVPAGGGALGMVDSGDYTSLGYSIEFDNYNNGGGDPSDNHIAIVQNHYLNHLASANDARTEDSTWHHVRVEVTDTSIIVYVDDMVTPLLNYVGVIDMTYGGFSFSAGTGGLTNNHWIDNLNIQIMAAPLPNIITGNQIEGNDVGILLWNTAGNVIYHNNFINNGLHAYDNGAANMWDAGYPTGGNYWSGFTGPDTHLGPTQSEPGSDGIIDHSYVIDADSMDRYPLKNMYTYLGIIIDPVEVVEDPAPGEEPVAEPTPVPNTYDTPVDPLVIEPEATPEATPEAAPAPEIESLDSAPAMPVTEPLVTIPEVSLPDASIQPEVVQATESADPIWMALLAVSSLAVAVALFFRKRI